ncbi:MAG: cation:proton antiporter [Planctomycetota bacterium]|jgi:CPA1 family monovalent cation:H+ antiporter
MPPGAAACILWPMLGAVPGSNGDHGLVSETVGLFVALLGFAATVAVLTKFVKIPYTVALVLAGLVVAVLQVAPAELAITEELVLVLFLPPLLFQAGLHMDLGLLQRKAIPVATLAIPGVLVSMVGVAVVIRLFLPENVVTQYGVWLPALLFGAMLAPTDPISVLATFKRAGAPQPLKTLVEGESLFNDGTGVVLFLILRGAVAPVAAGAAAAASISVADGVLDFVRVTALGLVVGLGIGLIAFWLLARLDDHVLENAITVVLVWGSFIIAERVGASGVIAVVVAGLIMGNYGSRLAMSEQTRTTIHTFWESIDFIVNSIVFLLIGIELQAIPGGARELLSPNVVLAVGATYAAVLAARAVMVYPIAYVFGRHWPKGWKHVVFWAGLKGSIPLALVLGLTEGDALRGFLARVVFGVVLVSLLLQGLTIPLLIRWMGVGGKESDEVTE